MTNISLKLPAPLNLRVESEARKRRVTKSEVIRDCLEQSLNGKHKPVSCLDLAGDLAGCLSGPKDLATNPKYMKGFGR